MTETPRIAPLEYLPLFHDLAGRKALVIGTSAGAEWKAELLAAAGAIVERLGSDWTADSLVGTTIAVADIADPVERQSFAKAARRAGVLVNLIDDTDGCDVIFGTIVNRSPIVIGISTGGAAPMLGQSIRTRIEAILPPGISSWAKAAKAFRPRLKLAVPDFRGRRDYWTRFVAAAWQRPDRAPTEKDLVSLTEGTAAAIGSVTIMTVDPSDAELMTLKAVRALQSATVILHDDDVAADILELARREARRVSTADFGQQGATSAKIGAVMVELARGGDTVVRMRSERAHDKQMEIEFNTCRLGSVEISIIPPVMKSLIFARR